MKLFEDHIISSSATIKKRRTKRPRQVSPAATVAYRTATSSSSSSVVPCDGLGQPSDDNNNNSEELSLDLEEDMAECLILLSHGHRRKESPAGISAVGGGDSGEEVYECKTCSRVFPSFQALGGHRASHKRPKTPPNHNEDDVTTLSLRIPVAGAPPPPSPVVSNTKRNNNRVHECSICGAEFASGQALGGHMRRHRPLPASTAAAEGREESWFNEGVPKASLAPVSTLQAHRESKSQEMNKKRGLLSFDLNIPPSPEEDRRENGLTFPAPAKERVIVFSNSPLVDCHY